MLTPYNYVSLKSWVNLQHGCYKTFFEKQISHWFPDFLFIFQSSWNQLQTSRAMNNTISLGGSTKKMLKKKEFLKVLHETWFSETSKIAQLGKTDCFLLQTLFGINSQTISWQVNYNCKIKRSQKHQIQLNAPDHCLFSEKFKRQTTSKK